jgi:RHS repeat-associated protein
MDDPTTTTSTEGFGLMFYNARWYDPYNTHFTSPDTIIPEQSQGTQAWDRYAYVNNNPGRYADPSGHCLEDFCIVETGLMVYLAIKTFSNWGEMSRHSSPPVTAVPVSTSTPNPTMVAVQTQVSANTNPYGPLATVPTPGPQLVAAPTATPTVPPLGEQIVNGIKNDIDNSAASAYEPSIAENYVYNPYCDICNGVVAAMDTYNKTLLGLNVAIVVSSNASNAASNWWATAQQNPYGSGTPSPTSSPTSTRQPRTSTPFPSRTPTPFFRTPTATPR